MARVRSSPMTFQQSWRQTRREPRATVWRRHMSTVCPTRRRFLQESWKTGRQASHVSVCSSFLCGWREEDGVSTVPPPPPAAAWLLQLSSSPSIAHVSGTKSDGHIGTRSEPSIGGGSVVRGPHSSHSLGASKPKGRPHLGDGSSAAELAENVTNLQETREHITGGVSTHQNGAEGPKSRLLPPWTPQLLALRPPGSLRHSAALLVMSVQTAQWTDQRPLHLARATIRSPAFSGEHH